MIPPIQFRFIPFRERLARRLPWRAAIGCALALLAAGCQSDPPKWPVWVPERPAAASTSDGGTTTAPMTNSVAANNTAGTNSGVAAGTSPNSASATNVSTPSVSLDNNRILVIGDRITFKIVEDNDDAKPLTVSDSGEVDFPVVGLQKVVGKTCEEVAGELKKLYEAQYYRHATVVLAVESMSRDIGRVYASGALRTTGPIEIPADEDFTLSKAILRAGGFSDFANTHKVQVTRKPAGGGDNQTFIVDVGVILEKGRTDLDLHLVTGDMIYVPERVIRF